MFPMCWCAWESAFFCAFQQQKNDMRSGTLISSTMPWSTATGMSSFLPVLRMIVGRHTSMELMPATDIGARNPHRFVMSGVPKSEIISRMMLASRAIVASSPATCAPAVVIFICDMRTDESE